jgi:GT2 family glycosyltransferase
VGGFSVIFPGNYNDVDLSLKVRSTGRSIVCTGAARLYHFESRTREAKVLPAEFVTLAHRWDGLIQRDEFSRELER